MEANKKKQNQDVYDEEYFLKKKNEGLDLNGNVESAVSPSFVQTLPVVNRENTDYILKPDPLMTEEEKQKAVDTIVRTLRPIADAIGVPLDNLAYGFLSRAEGIGDALANLTALFGNDEYKRKIQDFVAEDSTASAWLREQGQLPQAPFGSNLLQGVLQSIGGMGFDAIANIAVPGAGKIAGYTALGLGAAGKATEEAYNDGADYGRGTLYGVAQGATEVATEMAFDSPINKIYGSGFLRPVASTFGGKFVKGLAGEAIEEVASELASPLEKAIYKGKEAFKEYGEGDYWKGVGLAGVSGALTAGIVGTATGSYSHANMASEFINDAQTEITKRANQEANGKLDAQKEAASNKKIKTYMEAAEKNLSKMSENQRAKFFENNKSLTTMFTKDGKIRPEFARKTWGGQSSAETANGAQAQNAGLSEGQKRYVSVNARYDGERATNAVKALQDALNEQGKGETAEIYSGELSSKQEETYAVAKRIVNNLNQTTGDDMALIVVGGENDFNALNEKNGNAILISEKTLSKTHGAVDALAKILFEEATHSTQSRNAVGQYMSTWYVNLVHELATNHSATMEAITERLLADGHGYGFTQEMLEGLESKLDSRENLTAKEQELLDEIGAQTVGEILGGNKEIVEKYASNKNAAEKILGVFGKIKKALSRATNKTAKAEYSRVERVEGMLLTALAEKGFTYQNGKVISARPQEEKENTAETVENDEAVRFSFKNSQNGMANDKLLAYSEEMRNLIEQNGNVIIDSPSKLQEVVDMAFDQPTKKATAYFGILTTDVLQEIESSIPNVPQGVNLFQEGRQYSVATTLDNIRHLVDEKKLSRGEVLDYLDRLADTIADFDSVAYSVYEQNGSHGILCKKRFADGTLISYSLVSNKRKTIKMQTIYLDSKDYQNKKRSLPTPADAKAPAYTPKARGGQTSDNSISQSSENVKPQSEKSSQENFDLRFSRAATPTAEDTQYLEAVKKGYMEAAGKMVENAAKKAGYNSPVLYHGTNSFGFTVFDLAKMDDGRSIFLTDSERIASTYSETGRREINSKIELPENLSPVIIASELNAYMTDQEKELGYKYMSFSEKSMKNLIGRNRVELAKLRGYLNGYDFDDYNQKRSFNQLLEELSKEYDAKNNNISTPLYLLINNTNLFDDYSEIDVSQLESNIRLAKELSDFLSKETEAIAMIGMDGYDIEILPVNEAKEKLQNILTKGTYALFVPLKNKVSINAEGKRWNALKYKADVSYAYQVIRGAHGYRIYNTFTNDTYYLADNQSGEFDTREEAEKKLKEIKSDDSYKYATLDTTRQISKWAKEYGYDGVIFENIMDNGGRNVNVPIDETANIYVIFGPNEAKSADPVTYDDEGNVIPLSERFNPANQDIRFSKGQNAQNENTVEAITKKMDHSVKDVSELFAEWQRAAGEGYPANSVSNRGIIYKEGRKPPQGDLASRSAFLKDGEVRLVPYEGDNNGYYKEIWSAKARMWIPEAEFAFDQKVLPYNPDRYAVMRERITKISGTQARVANLINSIANKADTLRAMTSRDYAILHGQPISENARRSVLSNAAFKELAKKSAAIFSDNRLSPKKAREALSSLDIYFNSSNEDYMKYLETFGDRAQDVQEQVEDCIQCLKENVASDEPLSARELEAIDLLLKFEERMFVEKTTYFERDYVLTGDQYGVKPGERHAVDIQQYAQESRQKVETMIKLKPEHGGARGLFERIGDGIFNFSAYTSMPLFVAEHLDGNRDGFFTKYERRFSDASKLMYLDRLWLKKRLLDFNKAHKNFADRIRTESVESHSREGYSIPLGVAIHILQQSTQENGMLTLTDPKGGGIEAIVFAEDENGKKYIPKDKKALHFTKQGLAALEKDIMGRSDVSDYIQMIDELIKTTGKWQHDTDIDLYGFSNIDLDSDKKHFPLSRYKKAIRGNIGDPMSEARGAQVATNLGITKKRSKKALAIPLEAGYIDDVMLRYFDDITLYKHFAEPVRNFQRIWNQNTDGTNSGMATIRVSANNLWNKTEDYYTKLLADLQGRGAGKIDRFTRAMNKSLSLYSSAVLGFNPRTMVSQTASYFVALAYINPINLAKGVVSKPSVRSMKTARKYSIEAAVRNQGNSFVQGETLQNGAFDLSNRKGKAERFLEKAGEIGSKGNVLADELTVGSLWAACQYQIKSETGIEIGTEENLRQAAKLYDKVIHETQLTAQVSERSELQRSNNPLAKTFSLMSSAPMKMISIIARAADHVVIETRMYKAGLSTKANVQKAWRFYGRVSTGVLTSTVAIAFIRTLFNIFRRRKKDKDKNNLEIGGEEFLKALFGMYPFIGETFDFINGALNNSNSNKLDVPHYTVINDLASSVMNLAKVHYDNPTSVRYATRNLIFSVGQFSGLPVKNIYTYSDSAMKWIAPNSEYWLESQFTGGSYSTALKKALEDGDEERANMIAGLMVNDKKITGSEKTELINLTKKGYTVLPRTVGNSITYDGQEYKLTSRQKARFQKVYGQASAAVQKVVALQSYRKLSDEVKAKTIKRIYDMYYNLAIDDLLGTDTEDKTVLFSYAIDPDKLALIVAQAQSLQADTDKNGNAIAGSKKQKVVAYIGGLKLTAAQKYMIMGYLGYKNAKGEEQVKAYINQIKSLTTAEKKALFEYSGYAA